MIKPTFLMCPPTYFEVTYKINEWMRPNDWNRLFRDHAKLEWMRLVCILEHIGAEVKRIEPQPGLPDMVFTANGAVVLDDKAFIANFKHKERRAESKHFKKWFQDNGFETKEYFGGPHEGAGDFLWQPHRNEFMGAFGFRSQEKGCWQIEKFFDSQMGLLRLVNPKFYHLDTCFCPLDNGYVLYYPGAFRKGVVEAATRIYGNYLIPVSNEDAEAFACNSVSIGDNIIMSSCSDKLRDRLVLLGYKVYRCPVPTFMMAGGSVKCLTLRLDYHK